MMVAKENKSLIERRKCWWDVDNIDNDEDSDYDIDDNGDDDLNDNNDSSNANEGRK